jgi:F-type H+-transporting ATPase subunit b
LRCQAAEGGVAALGIDPGLLIAEIISVVILLILLRIFAYKPILNMFDQRSQKIKDSVDQAERLREQSVLAEEEMKRERENARKERESILAQAAQLGEKVKEEARAGAKEEAAALLAKAQAESQREKEEMVGQLRQEFIDMAVLAAGKVIGKSIDKETNRALILETLEEGLSQRHN